MYFMYKQGLYKRMDRELRFKDPKYLDIMTRKAWEELDYNKFGAI